MGMLEFDPGAADRHGWYVGRKVKATRALKPRQVWAIRFFLYPHGRFRDRGQFDPTMDTKVRGCDVVQIRIGVP